MDCNALSKTAKNRTEPLAKKLPVDTGVPKKIEPMIKAWMIWAPTTALHIIV